MPALHAQYAEPDVHVLFERTLDVLHVAGLNDVDGDGVLDVVASLLGSVYALSGADGHTLWIREDPAPNFGLSLERMDWNGDGVLDVLVGAPFIFSTPLVVLSGVDGATLATLPTDDIPLYYGLHLATGGDFDGDGTEDLLAGTPDYWTGTGLVDAFRAGDPEPFFMAIGDFEFEGLGSAVGFVGDTSSPPDGRDEIAIGSGGILGPNGKLRVVDWEGGERYTLNLTHAALDLDGGEDLDGDGLPDLVAATLAGVLVFSGVDGTLLRTLAPVEAFDSVALVADIDGDGRADIAAGSPQHSSGAAMGGRVSLFSGASGALLRTITGTAPGGFLGFEVHAFGDLNGDGHDDLLVGAFGPGPGSVLVFSLGPCAVLDLETEDDDVTPLVNGQHIDTEFGVLATLTGTGQNAGLAIFDSTPGGPNDPSQDPDLLVGTGNLLILQTENLPPQGGVFPRPNDDDDGGVITFSFCTAVLAESVRLVDVDAGDADWSVVLTDSAGARRTYAVPSDWTGDLVAGALGHGVLDLNVLGAQPGFQSVATASDEPGFEPAQVVRIDVHVGGSGAVDDLLVCPSAVAQAQAAASVRNGSGLNPSVLAYASLPVIGGTFRADLDCSAMGPGWAVLEVRRHPVAGRVTGRGEVLVAGDLVHRDVRIHPGTTSHFEWNIPHDIALAGVHLHAQGLCRAPAGPGTRLARLDGRLSNAVELVLGF